MFKTFACLKPSRAVFVALIAGSLAACTTAPQDDPEARAAYEEANDPFEPANRLVFSANVMADQLVLQPAAVTYRDLVPNELKPPLQNLVTNLFMPISFIHAMLQGDTERAERAAARFVSALPTLLLGNTFPDEQPVFEDAGQTFAVWGMDSGPYVMLPVLGPSNVRDTGGTAVDFFIDPVGIVAGAPVSIGRAVGSAVQQRERNLEQVRELQRSSLDYYAAVRSLYRQQRAAQIANGEAEPYQPAPTIGFEEEPVGEGSKKEAASGN